MLENLKETRKFGKILIKFCSQLYKVLRKLYAAFVLELGEIFKAMSDEI